VKSSVPLKWLASLDRENNAIISWYFLGLIRYQKTYSKFKTCAEINLVDPTDDLDDEIDEVDESPPEGEEQEDKSDDEELEEREELLVQFVDFVGSVVHETGWIETFYIRIKDRLKF